MSHLIGITGKKRSGKDTLAKFLLDRGFTRFAFADPMKEAALALDPYIGSKWDGFWHERDVDEVEDIIPRLSTLVESEGWEAAKEWPEVRRTLQRLGTEMGRNLFGDTFWVDLTMQRVAAHGGDVVITDVRFPNEADAVKAAGGSIIRVTRAGIVSDDTHSSETAMDDYPADLTITNDGSLADLGEKVHRLPL